MKVRKPHIFEATAWHSAPGGASDTRRVTVDGYAKMNSAAGPLCVVNEYISSRVGSLMSLPVPPGAVLKAETGAEPAWFTLSFTATPLPPVDPAEVVSLAPLLAAEVIVFDILICNTDRHPHNLAFLPGSRRLEVYDHSHALLGASAGAGLTRFNAMAGSIAIDGSHGGNRHCLLDHITDVRTIRAATEMASREVRDSAIRRICAEAARLRVGLTSSDANALADLLIIRRDNLRTIIERDAASFRGIPTGDWGTI